jgi:hypothetical protein
MALIQIKRTITDSLNNLNFGEFGFSNNTRILYAGNKNNIKTPIFSFENIYGDLNLTDYLNKDNKGLTYCEINSQGEVPLNRYYSFDIVNTTDNIVGSLDNLIIYEINLTGYSPENLNETLLFNSKFINNILCISGIIDNSNINFNLFNNLDIFLKPDGFLYIQNKNLNFLNKLYNIFIRFV